MLKIEKSLILGVSIVSCWSCNHVSERIRLFAEKANKCNRVVFYGDEYYSSEDVNVIRRITQSVMRWLNMLEVVAAENYTEVLTKSLIAADCIIDYEVVDLSKKANKDDIDSNGIEVGESVIEIMYFKGLRLVITGQSHYKCRDGQWSMLWAQIVSFLNPASSEK